MVVNNHLNLLASVSLLASVGLLASVPLLASVALLAAAGASWERCLFVVVCFVVFGLREPTGPKNNVGTLRFCLLSGLT